MFPFYTPSELAGNIKKRLSAEDKLAFCSAIIIGLCCHLFILTNSMYNNDDIRYLHVSFDKPELGRWLLTYAAGISSFFSLPVVNGLLAIFYLALTSLMLIRLFDLKNKVNIVLVSGILVTFPTVACIFSYMFSADGFFLACLLSVLAAYFTIRPSRKWHWLLAAACLCCSVGIYQAYLPFTLTLLLLHYILVLLNPSKHSDKELGRLTFDYVRMLAFGMAAYYACMKLTLKWKHMALSSYQGINESSFPGPREFIIRLQAAYQNFFSFFKTDQVLALNGWLIAGLFLTLFTLLLTGAVLYVRNRVYKSPLRTFLLILCLLCTPPAVNVICLISESVTIHMLMRHAWCLLFVAAAVFSEKAAPLFGEIKRKLLDWVVLAALLLVVFNYFILSNIAYFNMNFRYEKTYALCMQIMDKIEESEDYDNDRPIAFLGRYSKAYKMDAVTELLEPMTGMKGPLVFADASRAYQPFIQNCLGKDITIPTAEEEEAIKATTEFQEMPRFPNDGCVRVINNITVIKINDD